MKTLALTTALILGFAAPTLAASQLEKTLGVDAGVYSVSELAMLADKGTQTSNDGKFVRADDIASRGTGGADVLAFARIHSASSDDSNERGTGFEVVPSTPEVAAKIQNLVAAEITANF